MMSGPLSLTETFGPTSKIPTFIRMSGFSLCIYEVIGNELSPLQHPLSYLP